MGKERPTVAAFLPVQSIYFVLLLPLSPSLSIVNFGFVVTLSYGNALGFLWQLRE